MLSINRKINNLQRQKMKIFQFFDAFGCLFRKKSISRKRIKMTDRTIEGDLA